MADEITQVRAIRVPHARIIGPAGATAYSVQLARGTRRDIAVHATPQLLREIELAAFLRGFGLSGQGFNGETHGDAPAVRRMLVAEFDRERAQRDR